MGDVERVKAVAAKAALNPRHWPDVLVCLGELVGSDMNVIERLDRQSGRSECMYTDRPRILAEIREPFEQHYCKVSPRHQLAHALPPNTLLHDDLVGNEQTLDRYEFYVDFLKPHGLRYFIGARVCESGDDEIVLSLQRAADRGRVTREERGCFAAVLPALKNAMAIHVRAFNVRSEAPLALALDALADPLAVINGEGHALFANRAMTGLIEEGDILVQRDSALVGACEAIAGALRRSLAHASESGNAAEAVVSSNATLAPLILRVVRLAPDDARYFQARDDALFCLFIDDPARPQWTNVADAMKLYGLTRREATVGSYLAAGHTIDEMARRLQISRNTIRFHLAALREKMGVRTSASAAAEIRRVARPFA